MMLVDQTTLKKSLALLPKETPKKLSILLAFQILISTLDIFAVVLLGVVAKSTLDLAQQKTPQFPRDLVEILRIGQYEVIYQTGLIAILVVTLFVLRTLVSVYGNRRIFIYLANQASFASREIVERMFRCKPQFVIGRNSQEFLYGITAGIDILTVSFLGSISILLTESVFLIFMMTVIFMIEPFTGLMALMIFALAVVGINRITSGKTKEYSSDYAKLYVFYNKKLLDTLLIYRELVLRQREIALTRDIHIARSNSLLLRAQLAFLPMLSKYLFELVLVLGGTAIALTQTVISDTPTAIASVTVFLAATSRILPSLIRAQGALISVRQSEGGAEITLKQLKELEMELENDERALLHTNPKSKFTPSLKIENMSFSYGDDSSFSLEEINLEVKVGQFVAIVGESGAGKTTLIDLILGMLTPKSGNIEISNHKPLDAIRFWPGKIAYVPQDVAIIDGDIMDNITLGSTKDVLDAEIIAALEKANLKDEVWEMPFRLHQFVGERGTRLSGGQRQRLGIARALYTNPDIIVFDEATSSLDSMTEKAVTDSIYRKKGDVTLIVVAHRLSTVKNADVVVLMDKGKLVAQGTFEEIRHISPKFDQQAKLANL